MLQRCERAPALHSLLSRLFLHSLRHSSPSTLQCLHRRDFASTSFLGSGHSRWSKIKHDKAKADARMNKQRSQLARDIEFASKEGGPLPIANPRLASVLAAAKKAGFPKALWEAAIARGQGRSASGAALEGMLIEALHGSTGVALMIDCLTDNRAKTLQETREKLKAHEAASAPVSYLFERQGRLRFGATRSAAADSTGSSAESSPRRAEGSAASDEDAVMEAAIAAGALDIVSEATESESDAGFVSSTSSEGQTQTQIIYTMPAEMAAVASSMRHDLEVLRRNIALLSQELIWRPNPDTMVVDGSENDRDDTAESTQKWAQLGRLVDALEEDGTVVGVFMNIDRVS